MSNKKHDDVVIIEAVVERVLAPFTWRSCRRRSSELPALAPASGYGGASSCL
jgi:hypothetical protein